MISIRCVPLLFRRLLFPFISLVLGIVFVYSFSNWFFIVRPSLFVRNLVIVETYIPAFISGITVWFWMQHKLNQLNNSGLKIHGAPRYIIHKMVAFLMLFFILHFTQIWVESSFAHIVELKNINDINNVPKSRFYKISVNSIDKTLMSYFDYEWVFHGRNRTTHQSRPHYNSEIYVVYPVFSDPRVTKESKPIIWLGLTFENSAESKEYRDKFIYDTMRYIKTLNPNRFDYLEKMTNRTVLPNRALIGNFWRAMDNGHYLFDSYAPASILYPDYQPFSQRVADDLSNMFCVWVISLLFWFGVVYLSDAGSDETDKNEFLPVSV